MSLNDIGTLNELREENLPQANINGKGVPARPLNYKKEYLSLLKRLKYAGEVFMCRAEAFKWPENQ